MIRKALGGLLESLAGLIEREIDPRMIREYIESNYSRLKKLDNLEKIVKRDLTAVQQIMIDLGWLAGSQPVQRERMDIKTQVKTEWFDRNGLVPGAGRVLDRLDLQGGYQEVPEILEKLQRHVEVKREKSLNKFAEPESLEQIWLERCDISILFSKYARRHHDLRFLNAALKMNEWYFRPIRKSRTDEITARFLLALAEQELSAKELLAC